MKVDLEFIAVIEKVLRLLVDRDYEELQRMSNGVRLDGSMLEDAVLEYGRVLTMPPNIPDILDVVEIDDAEPPAWSVWLTMWTLEEGPSDLTLELEITRTELGYSVEIDNLHVP